MSIRVRETREHHAWARKFFFCECLNFINVVIQIVAMDKFLGGEFSNYGMEVSILKNDFYMIEIFGQRIKNSRVNTTSK